MDNNEESDNEYFIQDVEDIAWRGLRKQGLSDDEIWERIIEAVDIDYGNLGGLSKTDLLALLLLEIHEIYEKFDDASQSRTSVEWTTDGFFIGALSEMAADKHLKEILSKKASQAAKQKGKSTAWVDRVIDYILRGSRDGHGDDLNRFREFVGTDCSIPELNLEITLEEGETRADDRYKFEETCFGARFYVLSASNLRTRLSRRRNAHSRRNPSDKKL